MAEPAPGLVIRKRRVEDGKPRISGYDPLTGEKTLIDPETYTPAPYELDGVEPEGELPQRFTVPAKMLWKWRSEGWVMTEPPEGRPVHAPGGPPEDPWRVTHTFVHVDQATFNFLGGPVTARVVHQPGRYDDPSEPSGKRVDWVYVLEQVTESDLAGRIEGGA